MNWENILLKLEGRVGILSINVPSTLNALSSAVLDELDEAIDYVIADDETYVLIITGEGKAFVAGADISEMQGLDAQGGRDFANKGMKIFRKIEMMEKPVIAAVNGYALGGGCELAMCCDIRIASEKSKFGQPEVGLGICPGFAGTQRLTKLVGIAKAKELIFTGDVINGAEAFRIGLANMVVPAEELMKTAIEVANKIASKGQIAVRYAKIAINRGIETDIETGMELEKNLFGLCFSTEDQKEAMAAFLERRKPNFKLK
jgi:enoyl-CoA hydratase